jgi:hypothetical protein
MKANPLTKNRMAVEQLERDPREIENVLMPIQEAFRESVEAGVAAAKAQLRELTRGEDTDPELAAVIAEKLDITQYDIPEELQNEWETTLGEAFMYGGREGSDFLSKAADKYSRVAARAREHLPEDIEALPDDEKPRELSDFFHALDRQADVTFLSGEFEDAVSTFQLAVESRGKFASQEPGPVACAIYGEAASLFMQGKVNEALGRIEEARNPLKAAKGEQLLTDNINFLETAALALDNLEDTSEREARLSAMKTLLKQTGGSGGGVKRINFNKLFDDAEREAANLEV